MQDTGAAGQAAGACGRRVCAGPATEADSTPASVPSDASSNEPAEEPTNDPEEPTDEPEDPSDPEPEPVDERTHLEIFADKYRGNYTNIDWAAEEENLGDLAELDWAELIRLVGYTNFSAIQNKSGLRAYYNSAKDDPDAYYDDLFLNLLNAREGFLAEKSERAESAPDSLMKHILPKDRRMVLGIYNHDELEELVDVIIHRVQPKAINLLMNNFQAFSGAGAEDFSSENAQAEGASAAASADAQAEETAAASSEGVQEEAAYASQESMQETSAASQEDALTEELPAA